MCDPRFPPLPLLSSISLLHMPGVPGVAHTPATRELSQAYRFQQGVTCAKGRYELRMRVQCDKCSKRMRRVEHLCRRVAFSSGMDSKTHSTTCTTSNATSVAHLLLLLPSPFPLVVFPIPFPKAISHRRTLAPSLQPGTLCRVARGVGLSCGIRHGGGGGGEVVGLLVALLRHLRSPPGKRLPAALSKDGSETRRSFFSLCGPKSADAGV